MSGMRQIVERLATAWRTELAFNALERVLLIVGEYSGPGGKAVDHRVRLAAGSRKSYSS